MAWVRGKHSFLQDFLEGYDSDLFGRVVKKQGISVRTLAKRADVPYTTMLELVRGKKAVEKAVSGTVYRIARVLDVSMEE
ncbi:MAG: helix-turn-helix domain-containing protein [Lachnospiraceae bacterium]